jgi:hypothetical protein
MKVVDFGGRMSPIMNAPIQITLEGGRYVCKEALVKVIKYFTA